MLSWASWWSASKLEARQSTCKDSSCCADRRVQHDKAVRPKTFSHPSHTYISNTTITSTRCFFCKSTSLYQHWNLPRGVHKSVGYGRSFKMFNPPGARLMRCRRRGFNAVTRMPVRGASYCNTCRRRYNRDVNAACNIAFVLKVFVQDGISRPAYLSRA